MTREALRNCEHIFRPLIEYSPHAIVLMSADGTVNYANPFTEHLTGYRVDEFIGKNVLQLMHTDELPEITASLVDLLKHPGDIIPIIFRMQHQQGDWRWIEGNIRNCLHVPEIGALIGSYQDITERKQIEIDLLQREERARNVIEQASEGIFVTDMRGRYIDVNVAGCTMSGYTREELLKKSIKDLAPEEDRLAIEAGMQSLLAGEATHTRWTMKRKDGTSFPIELSAKQLSNGDMLGIARNISIPMQIEKERMHLLAREQKAYTEAEGARRQLSTIFETITDGVIVCDQNAHILHTNAATRALIEQTIDIDASLFSPELTVPDQMQPQDIEDIPLPQASGPLLRIVRGESLSGINAPDVLLYRPDGRPVFINVSGAPIFGDNGEIAGGVAVLRDVTKRHSLEQQLQYSEQKLRRLVDANILGVAVAEIQGKVLEVNDLLVDMLGYSKDELLAPTFHWQSLTPLEMQAGEILALETLVATGSISLREKTFLRKDGSRFPTLTTAAMIDQQHNLCLAIILDISDRKAAEQRKQEFLSMVSHELRTPLTGIVGFLDLALFSIKRLPETPASEHGEVIKQITWMLQQAEQHTTIETRLVEALLDVAQMERHTFQLALRPRNLLEIVRDVTITQQQIAETRRIVFKQSEQGSVQVMVDADRIKQVLVNYLNNALKYAPGNQEITVGLEVHKGLARVYVQDKGPGLTTTQQQQIWERFYQTDTPVKQGGKKEGLGLGLYIAKVLIEQHHGQVGVESAPGEGSTFWFTLPTLL
ncbi:MAG TPA: PAS domain S-box protein [Ktedonobacteraceae bacterium]